MGNNLKFVANLACRCSCATGKSTLIFCLAVLSVQFGCSRKGKISYGAREVAPASSPAPAAQLPTEVVLSRVPSPGDEQGATIIGLADAILPADQHSSVLSVKISGFGSARNCNELLAFTSSNTELIEPKKIGVLGTTPDCQITLTPNRDKSGMSAISVTASDGKLISSGSFTFRVDTERRPITISEIQDQSTLIHAPTASARQMLQATRARLQSASFETLTHQLKAFQLPQMAPCSTIQPLQVR